MSSEEVIKDEKIITPGQLVLKRFKKNKLAIVGVYILIFMFLFSFIGPFFSPYGEYEMFYIDEFNSGVYIIGENNKITALNGGDGGVRWFLELPKDISKGQTASDGSLIVTYSDGEVVAINPKTGLIDKDLSINIENPIEFNRDWPDELDITLESGELYATKGGTIQKWSFIHTSKIVSEPVQDDSRNLFVYSDTDELMSINPVRGFSRWEYQSNDKIKFIVNGPQMARTLATKMLPNKKHILGTDRLGLDVLTRLMYGGRISLMVGFVVIIISLTLGVFLGGVAGYYRSWIDVLIMRIVDVFNCIPTIPIMLIISSVMISLNVVPQQKIYVLMFFLGALGWPYIARVVRGQILSLREQEFITAVEATGIKPMRKIYKHLIPNVMPQLIVIATLSIGSVILTESALSYLGMGLAFPYASWGNMVEAVNDPEVLRGYTNIWFPPGLCILLTVLSFNFIGDGLRDAFDPKMKR
ncbi:ABC transporter permease subunit [Thiospirochaeta perfilievii]|nr:ABC transporter permease subunit [Thiospirochaeta perfilievii]